MIQLREQLQIGDHIEYHLDRRADSDRGEQLPIIRINLRQYSRKLGYRDSADVYEIATRATTAAQIQLATVR